mmetsp:Transcript_11420/g.24422  ORF Transcript_11420/g.24422 Transcript_11420/m.24422 type:complete len:80 (+) Transcript_11420:920-1159(+)
MVTENACMANASFEAGYVLHNIDVFIAEVAYEKAKVRVKRNKGIVIVLIPLPMTVTNQSNSYRFWSTSCSEHRPSMSTA